MPQQKIETFDELLEAVNQAQSEGFKSLQLFNSKFPLSWANDLAKLDYSVTIDIFKIGEMIVDSVRVKW
jgi:hypothetical protein